MTLRVSFNNIHSRRPEDFRWTVFGASIGSVTYFSLGNDVSQLLIILPTIIHRLFTQKNHLSFRYPSKYYRALPTKLSRSRLIVNHEKTSVSISVDSLNNRALPVALHSFNSHLIMKGARINLARRKNHAVIKGLVVSLCPRDVRRPSSTEVRAKTLGKSLVHLILSSTFLHSESWWIVSYVLIPREVECYFSDSLGSIIHALPSAAIIDLTSFHNIFEFEIFFNKV